MQPGLGENWVEFWCLSCVYGEQGDVEDEEKRERGEAQGGSCEGERKAS